MQTTPEPIQKGFLISCDQNRQRQAIKDAYNFIEKTIDEIYPELVEKRVKSIIEAKGLQLNLESELAVRKVPQNRLLSQTETHVKCLIFVKINPNYAEVDPPTVVNALMKDVHTLGKQVTRFCHRIVPVERAFRAEHFRMQDELDDLFFARTKAGQIKSWALDFKCRNNSKFNYKEVLSVVNKIAAKHGHFADVYYPEWTLSIHISNHLMCIGIGERFKETFQFKLHTKPLVVPPPDIQSSEEELNQEEEAVKPDTESKKNQTKIAKSKARQVQQLPQQSVLLTEHITRQQQQDVDLL